MLEKRLAAEVLEVRVLHPAIAQSIVGKVIGVLEDPSPAISRVGNGGTAALLEALAAWPLPSPKFGDRQ